jgi:predicted phage terminase large subunit-like protein
MNLRISPQEAAKKILQRRSIRRNLAEWCRFCGYEPAKHHLLLIDRLEKVARGDIVKLAVFMPPGSAKSTYSSILFPPWFFANNPGAAMIAASHTSELADKWGRRVRNLIADHCFTLGIRPSADSQAAGRWALESGGEYYAAGVRVGIAGFRADLANIDDPIRSREDADSQQVRDRIWDWYKSDLSPRLKPNARIILTQCMTGDTPVLMETGQEKPLREIRQGDRVATYDNGKVSVSTVRNWVNNGPDLVFAIRMKSGIVVKANARHPFLVQDGDEAKWQRTATLKRGSVILRVIGANGNPLHAPQKDVTSLLSAKAGACRTTINSDGKTAFGLLRLILGLGAKRICATAMELVSRNMRAFWPSRVECVLSASSLQRRTPLIGPTNFASIIATAAKQLEVSSVTTVIIQSGMETPKKSFSPPLSMCEITADTVVDVVESGVEDVFDVQIDRTENFIANGLVSHNTRWHEDDLAGRFLEEQERGGDKWEVVSLPAEAEEDDLLDRKSGEWLWDDEYGYGDFLRHEKATQLPRNWSALYQQRPTPDSGDYFKSEWLKPYDKEPARETLTVYGASDYAVTADGGDFTVHVVIGIDPEDRIYLLDLWRKQKAADQWVEAFCDLVIEWKPLGWAEEQGQIKAGIGPFLSKRQNERRAYVARETFPTRGDKAVRAQSIRGRMALNGLHVPIHAPWYAAFRAELLSFPAGKHDDQVDALGLIGQLLDLMTAGRKPKKDDALKGDSYRPAKESRADSLLMI